MNIIHVVEPFASGVTTAIISITRELTEVNHTVVHGSRMWVDSLNNVKKKFPPGVEFLPWKHAGRELHPIKDLRALFSLMGILKGRKSPETIVHLHSSKAGFLGRLACRLVGIKKVIYTPHGASFIRKDVGETKRRLFRFLEKLGGSFGGLVVGCGESEGELYSALGRPAKWVANGVASRNLPKDPDPRWVTFVGIANEQKNPAFFNEIAGEFSEEAGDTIEFLWVGEGMLKDALTSGNIRCTGWVEKEEVDEFLKGTLVYLSTSGWEGLPYGVLEAMDASCALLVTDVPGNRDLVRPGENGFLFSRKEEAVEYLKMMMADRKKTEEMGRAGRRLAEEQFSLRQMGEGYRAIYASMIVEKSDSNRASRPES